MLTDLCSKPSRRKRLLLQKLYKVVGSERMAITSHVSIYVSCSCSPFYLAIRQFFDLYSYTSHTAQLKFIENMQHTKLSAAEISAPSENF
jgi:hypothetical protein